MRKNPVFSALLFALLFSQCAGAAEYSGRARVIDGDTFSIRQQRIRIAAIDACERSQTGWKNGAEWACGVEARSYLSRLIDGKHVTCTIIDEGQYRRLVGQCFIQQTDIGLEMVKAGQAPLLLQYLPRGNSMPFDAYHQAEDTARGRRLGQWAAEIDAPSNYRRSNSHQQPDDNWTWNCRNSLFEAPNWLTPGGKSRLFSVVCLRELNNIGAGICGYCCWSYR